tara:strand:- start:509 stop:1438 length:930 start_codon:yes stop_codon:yes gene_type:complete
MEINLYSILPIILNVIGFIFYIVYVFKLGDTFKPMTNELKAEYSFSLFTFIYLPFILLSIISLVTGELEKRITIILIYLVWLIFITPFIAFKEGVASFIRDDYKSASDTEVKDWIDKDSLEAALGSEPDEEIIDSVLGGDYDQNIYPWVITQFITFPVACGTMLRWYFNYPKDGGNRKYFPIVLFILFILFIEVLLVVLYNWESIYWPPVVSSGLSLLFILLTIDFWKRGSTMKGISSIESIESIKSGGISKLIYICVIVLFIVFAPIYYFYSKPPDIEGDQLEKYKIQVRAAQSELNERMDLEQGIYA